MDFVDKYITSLPPDAKNVVEYIIVWVGFSTIVGIVAKAIMFGSARTTTTVTILVGWLGTIIGWSIARIYTDIEVEGDGTQQLFAPATFLVAVCGAIILLLFHKLMAGRMGIQKDDD